MSETRGAWDRALARCRRRYERVMGRVLEAVVCMSVGALGVWILWWDWRYVIQPWFAGHRPFEQSCAYIGVEAQERLNAAVYTFGALPLAIANAALIVLSVLGVALGAGWLVSEGPVYLCAWWKTRRKGGR